MKKPNMTTAAAILFAVATVGVGAVGAQSVRGPQTPDDTTHRGQEMHQAIESALENGDYDAFVAAHGENSPMLKKMTPDHFAQMQEMHALREAGDTEGAKALAEELGLPRMMHDGMKGKQGMWGDKGPRLSEEARAAVEAALEAGDYDAFIAAHGEDSKIGEKVTAEKFAEKAANFTEHQAKKAAIDAAIDARDYDAFVQAVGEDGKRLSQVNESNFAQFAELHDLREAGDKEAAKALAEEMGLQKPEGRKRFGKRAGFGPRGR